MNPSDNFPDWLLKKWQETADLLAESIAVPAALIMRHEDEFMQVFTSSSSENNPYITGAKDEWYGLYCETVINSQHKLLVPNALIDEKWKNNPDVKLGMIAYLGFPLNFPDNEPFGTLCVLDNKERYFTPREEKLVLFFREAIEFDLHLIDELDCKSNEISESVKKETEIRIDIEKQLKINQELYRIIAENSADTISILNPLTLKYSYVSPSVEKLLGYSQTETLLLGFENLTTPESYQSVTELISKRLAYFIETNEQINYIDEFEEVRKDGKIIFVETNSNFFYNQQNEIEIISTSRDITEKKQTEEYIKRNELRFRMFTDYSPLAFYMTSGIEQKAEYINPTYTKMFGYTLEEVPNNEILWSLAYPDENYRNQIKVEWDRKVAIANETNTEIEPIETIVTCKDGSKKHISWGYISTGIQQWTFGLDISHQKQSEESIREIGNNYLNLFNSVKQAIYIQDTDLTFINVNQGAVEMYGYEREYFIGRTPEFLSAPGRNDLNLVVNLSQKAFEGKPQHFEFWGQKKDGTVFPKELWVVKGKYFGKDVLIALATDITDRKQAEIALKESESKYQQLSDATYEAIFLSVKGICVGQNNTAERMFGYTIDEALGRYGTDWIHPDYRDLVMKNMISGFEQSYECVAIRKDGTTFPCEIQGRMSKNAMGEPIRITALRDNSERKRVELKLHENEEENRAILNAVPDLIFHLNNDGVFIDYRSSEKAIFYIPPEKFMGQKIKDVLPFEMSSQAMTAVDEALRTSKMVMYDYFLDTGEGKREYFENRIVPISNDEVISVIRDITERKLFEDELKKSKEQLSNFATHIQNIREEEKLDIAREIHDSLGQFLVALKIDIGLLKRKISHKEEKLHSDEILYDVEKILLSVNDSIKSSRRIINGLRPELLEQLGFEGAVKDFLHESEVRNHFKCEFKCEIKNYKLAYNQELALFRIVQEALNNIVKYANATLVNIHLTENNDMLVLEVIDNGIGFDVEKKGRPDSYGLMGMRERAVLLDADLFVISEIGKGTKIKVEIPFVRNNELETN